MRTLDRFSRRIFLAGATALGGAIVFSRLSRSPEGRDVGAALSDQPTAGASVPPTADAIADALARLPLQDSWLAPPAGAAQQRAAWTYQASFEVHPAQTLLVVAAAGRYELRVDGRPVARGPGPFTRAEAVADVIDLSEVLADATGEVSVEVVVIDPALETPRSERPHDAEGRPLAGGHAMVSGLVGAGLWSPDDGWRVVRNDDWDLTTPRINHVLPWVEHRLDAALGDTAGERAGRSRAATDASPLQVAPGPGPYPATVAVPRQAALAPWLAGSSAERRRPRTVVRAGTAAIQRPGIEDLFLSLRATEVDGDPSDAAGILDGRGWQISAAGRDVHLVVDLGQVWFGTPYAVVDARPGAAVDIATSEALDEDGRLVGDDVGSRHAHRLAADRVWRWEPHGARYLHLAVRRGGSDVAIREVGLASEPTPVLEGAFSCSDDVLTRVWQSGARTLAGAWNDLLAADAAREQRAWVGDLHVALRVARCLWWERSRIEGERFLRRVAQSARPDGSLPKHAPGEATDASTIPSYVLAWVLALHEHESAYRDGVAGELAGTREGALAWFDRWRRPDGLVAGVEGWHFFDWTPVRAQGVSLHYTALRAQVDLAAGQAPAVTPEQAAEVFAQDHRPAWSNQQGEPQTSQAANAHAILAGLLNGEPARAALRDTLRAPRYFERQSMNPDEAWAQMDLTRESVAVETYQGAFLLDALAKVGLHAEALHLVRERWGALAALGPTLGELWQPKASRCHPWSAAPTYWLINEVLGLRLAGPSAVEAAPTHNSLPWAEGAIPTRHGPVTLRWERSTAVTNATLTVPDGAHARAGDSTYGSGTHELTFSSAVPTG